MNFTLATQVPTSFAVYTIPSGQCVYKLVRKHRDVCVHFVKLQLSLHLGEFIFIIIIIIVVLQYFMRV